MKLSYIIAALEEYAPLSLQESWDNSGLQIGLPPSAEGECTGAMLCIDVTEDIVAEAVRCGCNLIISHHPLIFKGVKSIAGRTPVERTVAAAIRAGVAVYSSHTALDSTVGGISYRMASLLGAEPLKVLAPANVQRLKIEVICPRNISMDVQMILLGHEIERCDYYDVDAQSVGEPDDPMHLFRHTPLCKVEANIDARALSGVKAALKDMPGGSDLKIDVTALQDCNEDFGLGLVATFNTPITEAELLKRIKEQFHCGAVKASLGFDGETKISRIALCGGSGGEFIGRANRAGAQAYITADIRYHDFADLATSPMAVFDIGHFESEACAKDIFFDIIKNKFPNFAVYFSEIESVPVKYL